MSNQTISSFQCPITLDFDPTNISHAPGLLIPTWTSFVAINSVLSPLTVLINFLVIWTVLEKEQLRSDNYYFLVAVLSLSDLLVGLIVQPLQIAAGVCILIQCSTLCELTMALVIPSLLFRTWTAVGMAIISIERYLFIEHPLYYQTKVTSKKLMIVTAASWLVVGTAVTVSRLLADNIFWMRQLPFILIVAPSVVVTLFCVSKVNLTARRQMRVIAAQRQAVATQQQRKIKEYKRTFTLGLIVLASVACLCPVLILKIVGAVKGKWNNDFKYISQTIFVTCFNLQSIINPIIYSLRLSVIRTSVANKLRLAK